MSLVYNLYIPQGKFTTFCNRTIIELANTHTKIDVVEEYRKVSNSKASVFKRKKLCNSICTFTIQFIEINNLVIPIPI